MKMFEALHIWTPPGIFARVGEGRQEICLQTYKPFETVSINCCRILRVEESFV
jgi:hypothetical protein